MILSTFIKLQDVIKSSLSFLIGHFYAGFTVCVNSEGSGETALLPETSPAF